MRLLLACSLSVCFWLPNAGFARAQAPAADPPPPPAFSQLFPRPSGENGYEELVQAGDALRGNRAMEAAEQSGVTLAVRRQALLDPDIQRALLLLRKGLKKPVYSPRQGQELDENTLLPEYAPFRRLARLLRAEQYVLLADGRVTETLDNLRDGLLLGHVIQTDTLIGGLVGIAIDAIMVNTTVQHLNQFSARDCDRLIDLVKGWLALPCPIASLIDAERHWMTRSLQKKRQNLDALLAMISFDDMPDEKVRDLKRYLNANPNALDSLIDQTAALMNAVYQQTIEDAGRPAWERKGALPYDHNTMSGKLFDAVGADMSRFLDRYDTDRANLQLLALHAAIRRYRWEHDRPPDSLSELRENALTLDPFTGKPLLYKRDGDTYELYSAGPFAFDENGKPTTAREPVYLPRRPR